MGLEEVARRGSSHSSSAALAQVHRGKRGSAGGSLKVPLKVPLGSEHFQLF